MRRFLLPVVVVVLALAVSGCGARSEAGRIAAVQEISAGDKLLAAKDYDGAYDRYVKAANECTSYPLYDEAGGKATSALVGKVGTLPIAEQLPAFRDLSEQLPYAVLPIPAHIWLSNQLHANAEQIVAHGKSVSAGNRALLAPTKKTTATKPLAKKPAVKKPAAKRPASVPAVKTPTNTAITVTRAATPTAAAVATTSVATTSAATTMPPFVMPSPADLRTIAQALPGLGQPPGMQQLYTSLAEIAAASQACEQARAGVSARRPMTLAQRRTLAAADARLTRALQSVQSLLASL